VSLFEGKRLNDIRTARSTSVNYNFGFMAEKPTIHGLRFLVEDVLDLLASGLFEEDIIEQHPIVEVEDSHATLLCASMKMKNTSLFMQPD